MLEAFKSWIERRRPKRLDQLMAVEFDEREIRVRVLEQLDATWNQSFEWSNIRRVCFKDGGMFSTDIIYVSLWNPDQVQTIPSQARGASEFFGALCDKGYFPEHVWRRAIAESSGGMHCWPKD